MTYIPNPFRIRLAEQQRDTGQFLRTFGAGMLDLVPDANSAWDRLVVLQSAPGAGKTSLLRMFTPAALRGVATAPDDYADLLDKLVSRGALADGSPAVLGVLIGLGKDYKALLDLGPESRGGEIVFYRLLDARIIVRFVEASLVAAGLRFPADAARIQLSINDDASGEDATGALARLLRFHEDQHEVEPVATPVSGDVLLRVARRHEADVLALLDSLLPVNWSDAHGHSRLYSLPLLSGSTVVVDGNPIARRTALLFDDVHDLASEQRRSLYAELMNRTLNIGRWIAERYTALEDDELLTDSSPDGRDVRIIRVEEAISTSGRGGRTRSLDRVFNDIANSRARGPLSVAGITTDQFTSLLRAPDDLDPAMTAPAHQLVLANLEQLLARHPGYRIWVERAMQEGLSEGAMRSLVRAREVQVLIERDAQKPAPTLFESDAPERDYNDLTGSDTRAAARLFLAREARLPYYAGASVISELASRNVEQYLGIAGDLFDLMSAAIVLDRPPALAPEEQDRQVRLASRRLWEAIPNRVSHGADVMALLHAVAANARSETYRPNAPYAPGVTGTAFPYFQRERLATALTTNADAQLTRLAQAVTSAIANNLLEVHQPNKTKNGTWTVLYLNRLLCPYFDLPLQRGGFREQTLPRLGEWLLRAAEADRGRSLPDPQSPLPGVERVAS